MPNSKKTKRSLGGTSLQVLPSTSQLCIPSVNGCPTFKTTNGIPNQSCSTRYTLDTMWTQRSLVRHNSFTSSLLCQLLSPSSMLWICNLKEAVSSLDIKEVICRFTRQSSMECCFSSFQVWLSWDRRMICNCTAINLLQAIVMGITQITLTLHTLVSKWFSIWMLGNN